MSFKIGLRVYRVECKAVDAKNKTSKGSISQSDLNKYFKSFLDSHNDFSDRDDMQRSWYVDVIKTQKDNILHGTIRYGTYGFSSDLIDKKTKKTNYERKIDDSEVIPIYYMIWSPPNENYSLIGLQSFGPRSCVTIFTEALKFSLAKKYKGHRLYFNKLTYDDSSSTILKSSPVQKITLISKNTPKDKTDKYLHGDSPDMSEVTVSIKAKKSLTFGTLKDVKSNILGEKKDQVYEADGIEFEKVKATIKVGKKLRTVGVFGYDGEAGAIDITDDVKIMSSGHPEINSIAKQTKLILDDFHDILSGI